MSKKQKQKSPFRHLIAIPIQIVIDIVILIAGVLIDVLIPADPNVLGHKAPAFTIFAFVLAVIITVIVVLIAVIRTIVGLVKQGKEKTKDE